MCVLVLHVLLLVWAWPQLDIEFVRVDAQPAKQAISTWCTKWLFTFTHHLQVQHTAAHCAHA
jgi:hypothetical protein